MTDFAVRPAEHADRMDLARMRALLWPEASVEEHLADFDSTSSTLPTATLVAHHPAEGVIGFLDVGLRSHADGCDSARPVGFVEGWFVQAAFRRLGVGRALVEAAEEWARAQGCVEMASDTWIDHEDSQRAHEALGFEVVDRVVNFRKGL